MTKPLWKKDVYKARIKKVQKALGKANAFVTFCPVNILYASGLSVSKGALVIAKSSVTLHLDSRYTLYAKEYAPVPVKEYTAATTFPKGCGFDPSVTPFALVQQGMQAMKNPFPLVRACKEKRELALIQKSIDLMNASFAHIKKKMKEGVSEKEIALAFEIYAKKHGAEKMAFDPIIAFGKNAAMPHYHPGTTKLKRGIVLQDAGVVVSGYASDTTRCFFNGNPRHEEKELFALVERAHKEAVSTLKPGCTFAEADEAVCAVFQEEGMEQYYMHALGHGIGLETHEFPLLSCKRKVEGTLQEGMVVTIEPGLYVEGVGGIRLEEMYLITKHGAKRLSS